MADAAGGAVNPPAPWTPPTLATERLVVRPLHDGDLADVFAYARDPEVSRYTLWDAHASPDATRQFLAYARHRYAFDKVPEPMGVALKPEPGRVIGAVGCYWSSFPNRTMELGFAIGRAHWGRGYTAEAARALLDYCFAHFPVERMQAHCMAPNEASARVLTKLGMTFEGVARSALLHRGRFWDLKMHSVLRGEWPAPER